MKSLSLFFLCFVALFASAMLTTSSSFVSAARRPLRNLQSSNSSSLRVATMQFFPVTNGPTPVNNTQATAAAVTSFIFKTYAQQQSTTTGGGLDLVVFPEFLFQAGLEYAKSGSCSGDGTNSSGELRNYCYPVPEAGQYLDCNSTASNAPASIVGCNVARASDTTMAQQLTVSLNVCEKMANGTLYNTQVIIRNGQVLAKYRKFHPFFTSCFTKPDLELVTFDVKGTRFGVFTCFDIVFHDPKMDLVKMGVKFFSYSVAIPLVGLPAVELFSLENKVTVVSSNANVGQSGVVVDGKAVKRCTGSNKEPCAAIYDL